MLTLWKGMYVRWEKKERKRFWLVLSLLIFIFMLLLFTFFKILTTIDV